MPVLMPSTASSNACAGCLSTDALGQEQARWLLATIAFHCIALADTVHSIEDGSAEENAALEREFTQGMHALMIGALHCIKTGKGTPPELKWSAFR